MSSVFQVIQFPEICNVNTIHQFHQDIGSLIEAGVNIILLDFSHVPFVSSSGLMAIILAFRLARTADSKLLICSANEQIRMLFELTGVDQVFETFANLEEFTLAVPLFRQ